MRLSEAVDARHAEHWDLFGARWAKEDAERERIAAVLAANPCIGVLQKADGVTYYTWPAGGPYREARDPAALVAP